METNAGLRALKSDIAAWELFTFFRDNEEQLGLGEAELYYDFPVLKDLDDDIVISQMLLVSRRHGVIALATSNAASYQAAIEELPKLDENLEHVFSLLYSRLLRNRSLLRNKKELAFPIDAFTFSPFLDTPSTC